VVSSVDLMTYISGGVTLCGIPFGYFLRNRALLLAEKRSVEDFINSLSTKDVLTAKVDDEVQAAVIGSLENIINEIKNLVSSISNEDLKVILTSLEVNIKKCLRSIYILDLSSVMGVFNLHRLLQRIRKECANTIVYLCGAFEVDIKNKEFEQYILNYTIKPR